MKKIFTLAFLAVSLASVNKVAAQDKPEDKSKRPSPPAMATQKIKSGATITINYSQPSVKGRTIGKDLEPMEGKVWRTGANEATVFETDKEVTVEGKSLPAGKYAFFTIFNGDDVTLIFNKTWNQWGAFVNVKASSKNASTEKMAFKISPAGLVTLLWGTKKVDFSVK